MISLIVIKENYIKTSLTTVNKKGDLECLIMTMGQLSFKV